MHADERAVSGEPHIAFDCVRAILDRLQVGGEAVLGLVLIGPAMRNDLGGSPRNGLAAHA